jgi:prevent-host-death family protein
MVIIMTMIIVNIHDAKAKLSEYLEAAARGERVLICKRNQPVAELRAVAAERTTPRPVGGAKGRFTVPASFFDPLPDDVLAAFEGSAGVEPQRVFVAAEAPTPYGRRPHRARAKARR